MNKEKQREFARLVSQANRTQLVAITYDIMLENIRCAKECLGQNTDMGLERIGDNLETFRAEMKTAQRFLAELMRSLDFKYQLSKLKQN